MNELIKISKLWEDCTHYAIITFLYWWNTPSRKGLQTNNTLVCINVNAFSVEILFQLPPCIICLNTQIYQAVMTAVFFFISSKQFAFITSLQSEIHPSIDIVHNFKWLLSQSLYLPFCWQHFNKKHWDLNLKKMHIHLHPTTAVNSNDSQLIICHSKTFSESYQRVFINQCCYTKMWPMIFFTNVISV